MTALPGFPLSSIVTLLPGTDRKRTAMPYRYRISYQNPQVDDPGCMMMWEVSGGRAVYQVALERTESGSLRLHCTCADAVFRAENEGRFCKHIHGLLQLGEPAYPLPFKAVPDRGA